MSDKKTVGERVDKALDKVSKNVDRAKGKIGRAKEDVSDAAHDISKSVKRAVEDSGDAVSKLTHKKK